MAVRLVALDLDGTLLTTEKKLTDRTRRALGACLKNGIQIVPTTGRILEGIPGEVMNVTGMRYAIVINGAAVIDRRENKTLLRRCMTWDSALQVMEIAERYPVMYDAYIDGRGKSEARFLACLENYHLSPQVCALIRKTRDEVESLRQYVETGRHQVEKLNITFTDKEIRKAVRAELEKVKGVVITSSTPFNLEINEEHATKGEGLRFLAQYLQLKKEETMAFGDGENDHSMIKAAGVGIAMGNGASFLKAAADYVAESNDEEGVARVLESVLEKQPLYL